MSHRHLCGTGEPLYSECMRLPQSIRRRISIYFFFLTIILFFTAMLAQHAQAVSKQLQVSPAGIKFGTVPVGQSELEVIDVTNTGQTSATISAINVGAPQFKVSGASLPLTLAAGKSMSLSVSFSPSATGWFGTDISVESNASNSNLEIPVGGTGVTSDYLTSNPSSVWFGKVQVGNSATLSAVLTNASSLNETLTAFQVSGSGFSVSGPTLPVKLSPGQTVSLSIKFAPQSTGTIGGGVFVSGPSLNIPLTGQGTPQGQLTVSPTALNFGSVNVGSTSSQSATLTAVGASVIVTSATSSNSQFTISGTSFPLTLNAGQSTTLDLVFSPTQTGPDSGLLTVSSDASDNQASESLTGTGVAQQYSVLLTWDASSSPVVGYNLYRGPAIGVYSKINTALDPATQYTDTTVVAGARYYYAATAVNSAGEESTFSTPIQVVVP